MVLEPVQCPVCRGTTIIKHGKTSDGKQRYLCQDTTCSMKTFIREYIQLGRLPEIKEQIIEMSLNGSGIRDIARVLKISPTTVIEEVKKETKLSAVNTVLLHQLNSQEVVVKLRQHIEFVEEAESDEMWSFVGSKAHQRWLW